MAEYKSGFAVLTTKLQEQWMLFLVRINTVLKGMIKVFLQL